MSYRTFLLPLALALSVTALSGCNRPGLPKEISTQEVQTGVAGLFQSAPASAKQLANEVAEAMKGQDFPTAWTKLQLLAQEQGLNGAQTEFVTSSIAAVGAEVHKAEEAGNEEAKKALEFHRANK